jgi:hypothetical protein
MHFFLERCPSVSLMIVHLGIDSVYFYFLAVRLGVGAKESRSCSSAPGLREGEAVRAM